MHLEAGWKIVGVVTEARELRSEKNANWRGYVCKVATFGIAAELQLTEPQFKQLAQGQYLEFRGRFEDNKGYLKLMCESFAEFAPKKNAAT